MRVSARTRVRVRVRARVKRRESGLGLRGKRAGWPFLLVVKVRSWKLGTTFLVGHEDGGGPLTLALALTLTLTLTLTLPSP